MAAAATQAQPSAYEPSTAAARSADNLAGTDSIAGCVSSPDWADAIAADPASFYVDVHSTDFGPGAIRAQLSD